MSLRVDCQTAKGVRNPDTELRTKSWIFGASEQQSIWKQRLMAGKVPAQSRVKNWQLGSDANAEGVRNLPWSLIMRWPVISAILGE